jgi:hypothetical protein
LALESVPHCRGTTLTKEMFLNNLYGGMDELGISIFSEQTQGMNETRLVGEVGL